MTAPTQAIIEPYRNFKFLVEIAGFTSAGFNKVSGLKMTTDVIEYREGGENTTVRKLPGQTKFEPITLERGATQSLEMWDWACQVHKTAGGGSTSITRKDITIKLIGKSNKILRSWIVYRTWASEWELGELDAKGNDVVIERVVLQNEGIENGVTPVADDI